MAKLSDVLRVAMVAASNGSNSADMLELERLLLEQENLQLVRFTHTEPFLEFMQDLVSLPPHFILIEATNDGLRCLEQFRDLETGRSLPIVMLEAHWSTTTLERASKSHVASCVQIPSDPKLRLEVFTALVTYWCSINESAI